MVVAARTFGTIWPGIVIEGTAETTDGLPRRLTITNLGSYACDWWVIYKGETFSGTLLPTESRTFNYPSNIKETDLTSYGFSTRPV